MGKTVETHLNKQNSGEKDNALCHNTSRIKKNNLYNKGNKLTI